MCTRISRQLRPWVHWQVCFPQTFASYAMQDFWPNKPKRVLWWFWLLAHILSRLVPFVMCGMQAIPVYRDSRSITTFRKSMQTLNEELDIVLFPETDRPHGSYINDIDAGFIDIGKLRKRAGFPATFVPVYVCPALRTLSFGFPILYDNAATPEENRRVIAGKILSGITELAQEQPPHTPVTYRK